MSNTEAQRDKLIARIEAAKEIKRRAALRKPQYEPTPGQRLVLSCKASQAWNFSGNGGGKTTINTHLMHALMQGHNPWSGERFKVPSVVAFVVDTSKKIDEKVIPEYRKWYQVEDNSFEKKGRPYTSLYTNKIGSTCAFLTADMDPMTFEGVEYDAVIIDEPIPRPLYIALLRSLRKKGAANKLYFSGTAITQSWLRKEIYEPWKAGKLPHVQCFNLKTEDNKANLAENYISSFSAAMTESERKVRLEGGFFDFDSLALAEYLDADKHLIDDDKFVYDYKYPCVVAIDPHMAKPTNAVMLCATETGWVVVKELMIKCNATQFAVALREWEQGFSVVDRVCDSLGATDKTSGEGMHSFIDGLLSNGILVRSVTYHEKNHEDLIDRMRQCLAIPEQSTDPNAPPRPPKLRMLMSCQGLIQDIEQVTWQKNRATGETIPKLDTSTKDFLSCLGYATAVDLNYEFYQGLKFVQTTRPEYTKQVDQRRRQIQNNIRNRAHHQRIARATLGDNDDE